MTKVQAILDPHDSDLTDLYLERMRLRRIARLQRSDPLDLQQRHRKLSALLSELYQLEKLLRRAAAVDGPLPSKLKVELERKLNCIDLDL